MPSPIRAGSPFSDVYHCAIDLGPASARRIELRPRAGLPSHRLQASCIVVSPQSSCSAPSGRDGLEVAANTSGIPPSHVRRARPHPDLTTEAVRARHRFPARGIGSTIEQDGWPPRELAHQIKPPSSDWYQARLASDRQEAANLDRRRRLRLSRPCSTLPDVARVFCPDPLRRSRRATRTMTSCRPPVCGNRGRTSVASPDSSSPFLRSINPHRIRQGPLPSTCLPPPTPTLVPRHRRDAQARPGSRRCFTRPAADARSQAGPLLPARRVSL